MSTQTVSIREARQRLRHLLEQVQAGMKSSCCAGASRWEGSSVPSERRRPFPT